MRNACSIDLPAAERFATACPATAEGLLLCMCPFVPLDMFNAPESFAAIPARQSLWLLLLPISALVGCHDTVIHFGMKLHNVSIGISYGRQMATTLISTSAAAGKGEPQMTAQLVTRSSGSSCSQNATTRTTDLGRGWLDCKTTAPASGVAEDQAVVCRRQVCDK